MYRLLIIILAMLLSFAPAQAEEAVVRLPHGATITAAAWNADETLLFTAGDDGRLLVWDIAQGAVVAELQHENPLLGARWRGAQQVLTWQTDGRIALWQLDTAAPLWQAALDDAPLAVRWSPDQTRLLAYTRSQAAVWSAESGEQLFMQRAAAPLVDMRWSGADAVYLFDEEGGVRRFAIADGALSASFTLRHRGLLLGARWNADESQLLTWHLDGFVIVWRLAEAGAERLFTLRHRTFVSGGRWNADESLLITWAADDTVKLWDARTGAALRSLPHPDWVEGALWNADERFILTWAYTAAYVWDDDGLAYTLPHADLVRGARWNGRGDRVLTWSWDGVARIWALSCEEGYRCGERSSTP